MKSIKPGRGPSTMGAFGSLFAAIFGIFWTIMAVQMGAPIFFALFGVVFIVMAAIQAVYNFKNASGRNRMSLYDITDENEERDPIDDLFKNDGVLNTENNISYDDTKYCPYCGRQIKKDFDFCPKCGKNISNV